jgi:phosphate uptake regulator
MAEIAHTRRLVKAGVSSHTMALPKEWLERHKLGKGDSVIVIEKPEELLIIPSQRSVRPTTTEITILVEGKRFDSIQREITAAYLNNYSLINLQGKSIAAMAKQLRETLHDFVGLEIVEQTGTRVVAKDLLNVEEISIDRTIRRMDMMLRSLLQDAISEEVTAEGSQLRDQDINRLFFLCQRLLRRAVEDPAMAQRLGMNGRKTLLTWQIIHHIENIADGAARLPELLAPLGAGKDEALALVKQSEKFYLDAMKAYYDGNRELGDSVASQWKAVTDTQMALVQKYPASAGLVWQLNSMASLTADIARTVIDGAIASSQLPPQ